MGNFSKLTAKIKSNKKNREENYKISEDSALNQIFEPAGTRIGSRI